MADDIVKVPPQDLSAERAVLGSILLEGERLVDAKEFIFSGDFYKTSHRLIFKAMDELFDKREPIDPVTLSAQLESNGDLEAAGGLSYLNELTAEFPLPTRIAYYAQIVKERAQQRLIIKRLTATIDKAYSLEENAEDLLASAEQDVIAVSQGQNRAGFVKLSEIINNSFDEIESRSKNKSPVTGLPTYFGDLDALTTGLHEEELVIIAARPGVGKTAFALNLAENVATKGEKAVAIFSLEMGVDSLVDRMLASTGPIEANHLRTGQLTETDWNQLVHATDTLSKAAIYVDDTPGIKISEIRAKSRKLAREVNNLGLIVIDYLQLISGNGRENRQQEVSEISRQLKILAKELKIPVIALSQLSRSVESRDNKRPRLSDLRESGSIEQDADIVAFLYREDYYHQEGEEVEEEIDDSVEVIIEKNRSGSRGTAKLRFIKEYNKFASLDWQHDENRI